MVDYKMPSGEIREFLTNKIEELDPDYETESDPESESTDEEEHKDLFKEKKPETMNEVVDILIDKGGISTGNMLGVQNTFKCIEDSSFSGKIQSECFSTINLLIVLSNLYLRMMENEKTKSKQEAQEKVDKAVGSKV